jgi:hypothetical protein
MSDAKSKSVWATVATRQESAPKSVVAAEDNPPELKVRRTEKNNLARPIKKAATFRLPPDVSELVDAEIAAEAELGNRLTKDDAITRAVRAAYGKKARRK